MTPDSITPDTPGSNNHTTHDAQDRSDLAKLYPIPKSYEQRVRDDTSRRKAYRSHWPKRPYINVTAYGSAVFGLAIWFAQNLYAWWFGSSNSGITIAIVFLTFALGLGLVFLLIGWVRYVNKLFSYFGGAQQIFWFVYTGLAAGLVNLWLSGFMGYYTDAIWIPVLFILHVIMVLFCTMCTIRRVP